MSEYTATPANNPDNRHRFYLSVREITECLHKIDDLRDQIKTIIDVSAAQYNVSKKQVRRIAATLYKQNYEDIQSENEEFEQLYNAVMKEHSKEKLTGVAA